MTVQEALERFKALAQDERGDLCKAAVEALEKQIPKKPRKVMEHKEKNYYCSVCKHYVGDDIEIKLSLLRPNYCPDCGQALDWSEEE